MSTSRDDAVESRGALAGLRVLDTATLYAGPFISTLLADHGADVIKVEPPGGDDYRQFPNRMWPILARGKRSIELDLRSAEGCDVLRRLVAVTDVIVVNMPAAALTKRGLDYETLSANNPQLIMAHLTGFGLDGPYSARPGNGTLAEGLAGLTHVTGPTDGAPVLASVPLGDAVTGFVGAFGVLAACYHRLAHGGPGQLIDVNPVDAILHVIGPVLTEYDGDGEPPNRLGNRLRGSIVRNVFPTIDDRWVSISLSTPRHIEDVAALVGHAERDADGRVSGDLEASLRAFTVARRQADVIDEFVGRRLPIAPVNTARDITVDEHLVARGSVRSITTAENGPVASPAAAPRLLGSPAPAISRTPDVGEHSAEILRALGADRGAVRDEGASKATVPQRPR